jgi:hypothetical protein
MANRTVKPVVMAGKRWSGWRSGLRSRNGTASSKMTNTVGKTNEPTNSNRAGKVSATRAAKGHKSRDGACRRCPTGCAGLKGRRIAGSEPEEQSGEDDRPDGDAEGVVGMQPLRFGHGTFVAHPHPCGRNAEVMHLTDVPSDEKEGQDGQDENMQDIKAHQSDGADLLTAFKEVGDGVPDERNAFGDFEPHRRAPVGFLIPRQGITRQAETDDAQKEQNARHPNHLAGLFVSAPKEGTDEVDDDERDDEPCRPIVQRPNELAEGQKAFHVLHRRIGLVGRRAVVEHHRPTRDEEDGEAKEGEGAEDVPPADSGRERLRPEPLPRADQPCLPFQPVEQTLQFYSPPL